VDDDKIILFGHVMESLGHLLTARPDDEGSIRDYCEGAQYEQVVAVKQFIETMPSDFHKRLPNFCTLYDIADGIAEVLFERGLDHTASDLWDAAVDRIHADWVDPT